MLGRGVAARLRRPGWRLFSEDVRAAAGEADALVLNLECCVSERGTPWPAPGKPFFFRAPPAALSQLRELGVRCVTLANNHALDFGTEALGDTFAHLEAAGIAWVGAGPDRARARAPHVLALGGLRLAVVGLTDHPRGFGARHDRAGVAFADLRRGLPGWVAQTVAAARERADLVLVTPHWGPNMAERPVDRVRAAGAALIEAGASLVAGHSAHVFHGVRGPILWDLGDFIDDYQVDPVLRNDRGLLWIVTLDRAGARHVEALPLQLEYSHTRLARGHEREWIEARLRAACAELGTEVARRDGRLVIEMR
jgi:poly-gamma-glutamate synthesis protein (capsule biosynthesis protein)